MVILRTLLMLAGALAVLTLGALPAAAGPAAPPCHDMSAPMHHGDAPAQPAPAKAMKVMACCVMCVAAPAVPPVQPAAAHADADDHHSLPAARLTGRGPAPEHGPPRA
jgi:hypothetical protein